MQTEENEIRPTLATIAAEQSQIPGLSELLTADPDQFVAKYPDIAAINLACARGLPNCDESEFPKYMALLDTMSDTVRKHTERSWRLFKIKPAEFHNSENAFRVLMMEHVLRVQFGVKYDPHVREVTENGNKSNGWRATDSTETFIHGVLGEKRTGTCSSLPTFSIAIGRRLGYPLKLIRVPRHTLFRWDDGKELFNIQHTYSGSEIMPDEHFHTWPKQWDADMFAMNNRTKVWLHSMTARQEVSKFLCNRTIQLRDVGRYQEAFQAVTAAERFDAVNPACPELWISIEHAQAGGDVRALAAGYGLRLMGNMGLPVPNSFTMSSFDPPPAPKRPARQSRVDVNFSLEQARLVHLINESNRNRSPEHPNGNPPTAPLLHQLTQLLLNRNRPSLKECEQ